ncbi:MAG: ribonucleoside triphosphate reductase [Candidatus Kaiserbacteria bacterium]|nr:ribonucleoside triphosphate reductase [Candidatus Kaiserbacteria bacterium]MCB9816793.1 ribonucleoside triphosphate reductase [Candidatus Nomurabacteria bacterium]
MSKEVTAAVTHIVKRDGSIKAFDQRKISRAIEKAMRATGEFNKRDLSKATKQAVKEITASATPTDPIPTVEGVQDIVERVLMELEYFKTAKAYILYREQHAHIRRMVSTETIDLVDSYLGKSDWTVKENSNMEFSLQGLNNHVASEISRTYWLDKIYPAEVRDAHGAGDFHLHDLNLLSVYCVGWDLYDLLKRGFGGVPGKLHSAPPKHFRAALGQIVNFFYTMQGEAAGAQAFSNFDTLLAPFIWYDHLSYEEVKQSLQEFVFNVNVPTRVGFQTPFTNITMDLTVPEHYKNMKVIRGGQATDETYATFQREMDMLNQAFLEVMCEGDATGRVFTFPIPTYNITADFDWDNKHITHLWEAAAKYGIPYFSNFINSDMSPDDARSMCCRLRIDNRELQKRGGGLFGANPLTGSIGVVTMNLPRIAYNAKTKKQFLARLGELMDIAKTSLEIKREVLEGLTEKNLYPYTKHYLATLREMNGCYWQNHFSTIGLVGMNEAAQNLLGEGIATEAGQAFAEEVLDFMRDRLADYQEETGNNYNLEATPAEGTSYRLAKIDQKQLGDDMVFANGVGKSVVAPFYTNSTHLPVMHSDDPFEILELQDELQTKYTGGTVIHFFLGERVDNPNTIKSLVKRICEQYRLPYFTISPTFSVCKNHGYLPGEVLVCPDCHEQCEVYSRIVGYLRPVEQWNDGKKAEFELRETIAKDHDAITKTEHVSCA